MREVIAANVGLASRRRVKRKDDSARKNGAPPEWGERKRCRFLLGRETAVVRWWARVQASGGREVSQQDAEHRGRGRAPMEGSSTDRRLVQASAPARARGLARACARDGKGSKQEGEKRRSL